MASTGSWADLRDRVSHRAAGRPGLVLAGVFATGVLVGWAVLGWWLFPVKWTNTLPVDLAPAWRQEYVRLVAEAYARDNNDLDRAQSRLETLSAEDQATVLSYLVHDHPDPGVNDTASQLAAALGVEANAPPGAEPIGTPEGVEEDRISALLTNAATLLVLAVLAAALTLFGAWLWVRFREVRTAPLPLDEAGQTELTPEDEDFVRQVQTTGQQHDEAPRGAPDWRPERMNLGDTTTAHYAATEGHFYQTWLIYDERGGLVGGAGLRDQPIGPAGALVLWFFERDDEETDLETPVVTVVSAAAFNDPVFRARLSERNVIPAVPGQAIVLETVDLALDARIRSVTPDPESGALDLHSVTLSLTPHTLSGPGNIEDAEPPVPLPFRRD